MHPGTFHTWVTNTPSSADQFELDLHPIADLSVPDMIGAFVALKEGGCSWTTLDPGNTAVLSLGPQVVDGVTVTWKKSSQFLMWYIDSHN